MNLALPLWVFSDPLPPIKNEDNPNDPVMMGPIKAIPAGQKNYDFIDLYQDLLHGIKLNSKAQ